MAFLAVRDVTCVLCGRQFELLLPDLLPPGPLVCDACLEDVWRLETEALRRHVVACLSEHPSQKTREREAIVGADALEKSVVHHIQVLKEQWVNLEALIRHRDAQRRAGGGLGEPGASQPSTGGSPHVGASPRESTG